MSDVQWYLTLGAREIGPFSPAQLKAFAEKGKIRPDTELREEGMSHRVPASLVPGLFDASGKAVEQPESPAPADEAIVETEETADQTAETAGPTDEDPASSAADAAEPDAAAENPFCIDTSVADRRRRKAPIEGLDRTDRRAWASVSLGLSITLICQTAFLIATLLLAFALFGILTEEPGAYRVEPDRGALLLGGLAGLVILGAVVGIFVGWCVCTAVPRGTTAFAAIRGAVIGAAITAFLMLLFLMLILGVATMDATRGAIQPQAPAPRAGEASWTVFILRSVLWGYQLGWLFSHVAFVTFLGRLARQFKEYDVATSTRVLIAVLLCQAVWVTLQMFIVELHTWTGGKGPTILLCLLSAAVFVWLISLVYSVRNLVRANTAAPRTRR